MSWGAHTLARKVEGRLAATPDTLKRPYDPNGVEQRWYRVWEEAGFLSPAPNDGNEPFVISMPPAPFTTGTR